MSTGRSNTFSSNLKHQAHRAGPLSERDGGGSDPEDQGDAQRVGRIETIEDGAVRGKR